MDNETLSAVNIINNALVSPKKVETAEGRVEEHSLSEQIKAAALAEQIQSGNKRAPWGMALAQHIPTGEY